MSSTGRVIGTMVVIAVVSGGLTAAILLRQPEPASPDSAPPPPSSQSKLFAKGPVRSARSLSVHAPVSPFNPMPILPAAPGQANPYAAVPRDGIIDFHVQANGTAVAFGDVILGKVPEGWHGTRGRFDTPIPQLWDKPEIPYAISPDLVNPARVEQSVAYFRDNTPIRLVPYNGQPDAIVFETGEENCLSSLGRMGGLQPIKLSPKCGPPQIVHEVMHALGFVHEQSRPDRDRYVQVLWQNIEEQYQDQFAMVSEAFTEASRGSNFDYHSAMLYRPDLFAVRPDAPTLQSTGAEAVSPVNEGLSPEDIRRLNQLYAQPGQ